MFVSPPANPVWILLHSWSGIGYDRFLTRDLIVNILLYVPLGASGYLVFRERHSTLGAVAAAAALSLATTVTLELLQLYDPLRYTSALDVVANALGAGVGIALGVLFYGSLRVFGHRYRFSSFPDPAALALLLCWIAYLTFPFFPESGPTAILEKIHTFLRSSIAPLTVASHCITWIVIGLLVTATALPCPQAWLWMSVLLIPAQIVLRTRHPVVSELIGAVIGCALFHLLRERYRITMVTACIYVIILVVRGVSPIDWTTSNAFDWVPFASLLEAEDAQNGIVVLLYKLFSYAAAIWLVHRVGSSLRAATVGIAAILLCIELVQIHVPGRTPEITDAVIALLVGYALYALVHNSRQDHVAQVADTLALK